MINADERELCEKTIKELNWQIKNIEHLDDEQLIEGHCPHSFGLLDFEHEIYNCHYDRDLEKCKECWWKNFKQRKDW